MPENSRNTTAVDEAISTRQSVRAFLPTPVERATVEKLLKLESRGGGGSQPPLQILEGLIGGGDAFEKVERQVGAGEFGEAL